MEEDLFQFLNGQSRSDMKHLQAIPFLVILLVFTPSAGAEENLTARGVVFHDQNQNGKRDAGEPGLPQVLVSNQQEVVATDASGSWSLPARDDCIFFVIKPRGWMPPVSKQKLPRFYYIHKPKGSPQTQFPGVEPTGPLPASIDFPLIAQAEPEKFKAHFFGDTQSRNIKELEYMARDTIPELVGTEAKFGVTLGDILFDDLSLFEAHNSIVALVGIPWWNVIGNHDLNFDAPNDKTSDETFERVYGPPYHAFQWGPANFVVLDNVMWGGSKKSGGSGGYSGALGNQQITFLENLLPHFPEDQMLMLMMHIPLKSSEAPLNPNSDYSRLFRLIEKRPYTMSISGHTHWHAHMYLDEKDGWKGKKPHHHVVNVTVCGSWWRGEPDELGIPHSLGRDGAPRGYSTITFDGNQAIVDYKASRRPADYQLRIEAPAAVSAGTNEAQVYANVFNGSRNSKVRMRLGDNGRWITLSKTVEADPDFLALKKREQQRREKLEGSTLPGAVPSHHLWKASLPLTDVEPGIHRLWVQTQDMHGRTYDASHIIRVE